MTIRVVARAAPALGVVAALASCATPADERAAPSPAAAPAAAPVAAARPEVAAMTTAALGAELAEWRAIPGHANGGEWHQEVDGPGGRKVQVLRELVRRLGSTGHTRGEILAVMGEPDAVARPGDQRWSYVARGGGVGTPGGAAAPIPPGTRQLLAYDWRGVHDFYYFAVDGDAVLGAGWWYAGD